MTKTLLSVPERTLSRLKSLAQRRRTSVSRLLREAVEKAYGIDAGLREEGDWREDPLFRMIGTLDLGPDAAEKHDKYVYG